jgi:hypothetical protein
VKRCVIFSKNRNFSPCCVSALNSGRQKTRRILLGILIAIRFMASSLRHIRSTFKEVFMTHKIRTLFVAILATGSLMLQALPASADYWHWAPREHRWERRADIHSDRRDLDEARRQLTWDLNHHASRRKIAEDRARIRDLERDIHEDRRAMR